ncbi:hypothetical protein I4U23_005236 [Adineta vaga]|nr:hypothetical protein I4U23_005236 [Adineta vaga]
MFRMARIMITLRAKRTLLKLRRLTKDELAKKRSTDAHININAMNSDAEYILLEILSEQCADDLILFIVIILCMRLYHVYGTDVKGNTVGYNTCNKVTVQCNPLPGFYGAFQAFSHLVIFSCLPVTLMFSFRLLTLINIDQQRRLVRPTNNNNNNNGEIMDWQSSN